MLVLLAACHSQQGTETRAERPLGQPFVYTVSTEPLRPRIIAVAPVPATEGGGLRIDLAVEARVTTQQSQMMQTMVTRTVNPAPDLPACAAGASLAVALLPLMPLAESYGAEQRQHDWEVQKRNCAGGAETDIQPEGPPHRVTLGPEAVENRTVPFAGLVRLERGGIADEVQVSTPTSSVTLHPRVTLTAQGPWRLVASTANGVEAAQILDPALLRALPTPRP